MKTVVVINEAHTLMEDQKRVLEELNKDFEFLKVPTDGWTYEEQISVAEELITKADQVVFASPIPALLMILSRVEGIKHFAKMEGEDSIEVRVLHNDQRVAKEIPDGKGGVRMIHTVSPTGWILV